LGSLRTLGSLDLVDWLTGRLVDWERQMPFFTFNHSTNEPIYLSLIKAADPPPSAGLILNI